jgi:ATP-binding cassette subfamily B protein
VARSPCSSSCSPSSGARCSPSWRTNLETALRDDLYAQLQRLDVGFHDRWQSGQLLSRAMTDLAIIRRFVAFGAVFFVLITVQVLVIFGVLLTLHVPLALLTFALAVPVLVLCSRFEREYHTVVRRIQDETGDLTTSIEEGARGIRVLKAFGPLARVVRGLRRPLPGDPRQPDRAHPGPHQVRVAARRRART